MPITRRQFATAAGSVIALTVLGCTDEGGPGSGSGGRKRHKLKLASKPFLVGGPDPYRKAGVYQDYRESHGIWLVSDGRQLVALSAVCTHNGCGTRYDPQDRVFACPCHKSIFTTDGLNQSGKAKRPLERCLIELDSNPGGAATQVRVDPTRRYRRKLDAPISGRDWSILLLDEAES
jgi:Rieske Fe-S protein